MKFLKFKIILIIAIIVGAVFIHATQIWLDYMVSPQDELLGEMMYFPSGVFLKSAICDFDMFVANFVWLRAVQYYGHHALTDYHYPWLAHIFNVLFSLDPKFVKAHRFGGVLISEDGGRPHAAIELLKKAVLCNPEIWGLTYDIGYINYAILNDYHEGGKYFKFASLYEGPTGRSIRFAAHSFRKAKEYALAKHLWKDVLRSAETERRKETALRAIRYIQIEEDIEILRGLVKAYITKVGHTPRELMDFVTRDLLDSIPTEPYGGRYLLKDDSMVTSTTLLFDELELIVKFLNQRITAYSAAKGRFPTALDDLIKERFVDNIPKNPFGIAYDYDRSQGKVLLPAIINKFEN